MILKKLQPLGYLVSAIVFCFLTHNLIFKIFDLKLNLSVLNFSLSELYLLFSILSVLIISTSIVIKQKNIDLVGNVFMLITCVKMVVCFLLIRPFSNNSNFSHSLEKYNYLMLFMLFLILETTVTIFILNKKEP